MPASNIRYLLFLCLVILVLQAAATLSSFAFSPRQGAFHRGFTIELRTPSGLAGLFTAPFAPRVMWRFILFVLSLGDLDVWAFGRDTIHRAQQAIEAMFDMFEQVLGVAYELHRMRTGAKESSDTRPYFDPLLTAPMC